MITIDKESKLPVYIQIYRSIREDIIKGSRCAGDRMESVRALSAQLLVSKNTITKAYQQLVNEGFLENKPQAGYFIVDIRKYINKDRYSKKIENKIRLEMKEVDVIHQKKKEYRYDFSYHKMPLELYSEHKWKQCFDEALLGYEVEKFGEYGDFKGEVELREEIRKYLDYSRNVKCKVEQIVICSGLQESIEKICRMMNPGLVALECPNLPFWREGFEAHGYQTVSIPVYPENHFVEDVIESNAKVAVMTPSHQFPTGYTLSLEERMKLLEWGEYTDGIIIEDDYDCEFRYSSQPLSAMKSMDHSDCVLYLGTFSKILLPGLRINYMVLPEKLLKIHDKIYKEYPPSVAWITQKALYYFMNHDDFLRHIMRTRKLLKKKYELMTSACKEYFGDAVELIGTDAGLHILIRVKKAESETTLIDLAASVDVCVYSVKKYWNGGMICPDNLILLGFSYINENDIIERIKRLQQAWRDYL